MYLRPTYLKWLCLLLAATANIGVRKGQPAEVLPLKPLIHNDKKFFPIGAYGRPRFERSRGFLPFEVLKTEGWNTVLTGFPENVDEFYELMRQAKAADFAVILDLGNYVKAQDRVSVIRAVKRAMSHPATLGYYIFGEPENVYYNSPEYRNFASSVNSSGSARDLDSFIINKIGWAGPLIRNLDTNQQHYIFMCIAWHNHYDKLQRLCQVNMPNEYPTKGTKKEFEGPLCLVLDDARRAAKAARSSGNNQGFCYTPFAINIGLSDTYRYPTVSEFRYFCFAPITQGAMGIIYWAGYRCSRRYAEQVVFPVTRQLSRLQQFFLGEWLDERVQCDAGQSSDPLLKKLNLPLVSCCLRRSSDGRYLLLAVNNTARAVPVKLKADVNELSNDVAEFISGRKLARVNGVIADTMEPYGVCAYIMEPLVPRKQ